MAVSTMAVQHVLVRGRDMEAMRRNRRVSDSGAGRLLARPGTPTQRIGPGMHPLGLGGDRDAALYIPEGYQPEQPAPFVLSLHGAGGNELSGLYPLQVLADEFGFILLSPASRGRTWDVILGGFGPDIAFLDRALAATFERCAVDPDRIAVSGFSDGASYALSIGITNGDLFPNILAFSPGFAAPGPQQGEPRIFVSHGTRDEVLRIDYTSRRVVPVLQDAGYEVRYREFNGPHTVPDEIAREAVEWFLVGAESERATPAP
jgi:phospholipase/carboxylesterase